MSPGVRGAPGGRLCSSDASCKSDLVRMAAATDEDHGETIINDCDDDGGGRGVGEEEASEQRASARAIFVVFG